MLRKGCRKAGDEEGLACFWFGAEAQSSLRDFHLNRSLTQHGSQRRRTVLGYFRASLRDFAMGWPSLACCWIRLLVVTWSGCLRRSTGWSLCYLSAHRLEPMLPAKK